MKKVSLIGLIIIMFVSCNSDETLTGIFSEVCEFKTDIMPPVGYSVNHIGDIDFNGSVRSFKFLNEQTGYALLGNNVGGYVEVFKTTDGGVTWADLNIGIDQIPRYMAFKNENIGIISVHDVTGCPPPNCLHKCVILRTEDGGHNWIEYEIEEFTGILYHPKYDSEGNLYALASIDNTGTLVKSTDDGQTWEELFSSSEIGFRLVTFSYEIFEDKFFLSSSDGKLLVVDNKGNHLKTIDVGSTGIWDLEIVDEDHLFITLSTEVIKSTDGGESWETIYNEGARIVGFESAEKGLMLLKKSSCPTDVYQVNDLIAATNDGGQFWIEGDETTTNLRLNFQNSQLMATSNWYIMIGNKLIEVKEE